MSNFNNDEIWASIIDEVNGMTDAEVLEAAKDHAPKSLSNFLDDIRATIAESLYERYTDKYEAECIKCDMEES